MKASLGVAVLAVFVLAVALAAPAAARAPTGDRAVGSGVIGFPQDGRNLWFSFSATSGPNFENPAGNARIQFDEENGLIAEGTVDFLAVDGRVADMRVRVDQASADVDFLCIRAVDHGARDRFGLALLIGTGACPFAIDTFPRGDTFAVIDVTDRRR